MNIEDDGLSAPVVGEWAEEKHDTVSLYAKLFSTGMKAKWDELVYIELYSGSGFAKVKGDSRTIAGSPVRALLLEHPFDKYVFCEKQPNDLEALKKRLAKLAPSRNVAYVVGDCNEEVEKILAKIPAASASHRVLSLCLSIHSI
ncbi:MAG: three-Cys-motif partner protein TcmP [Terriglobales bacterium]